MRWLRQLTIVLLLVLWFGAREHCNLEAAGWIQLQCAEDCGAANGMFDGCDAVENATYKSTVAHVKLAAPQLIVCLVLAVPEVEEDLSGPVLRGPEYSEQQTRLRTWQFVERAAPPCRAPSWIA